MGSESAGGGAADGMCLEGDAGEGAGGGGGGSEVGATPSVAAPLPYTHGVSFATREPVTTSASKEHPPSDFSSSHGNEAPFSWTQRAFPMQQCHGHKAQPPLTPSLACETSPAPLSAPKAFNSRSPATAPPSPTPLTPPPCSTPASGIVDSSGPAPRCHVRHISLPALKLYSQPCTSPVGWGAWILARSSRELVRTGWQALARESFCSTLLCSTLTRPGAEENGAGMGPRHRAKEPRHCKGCALLLSRGCFKGYRWGQASLRLSVAEARGRGAQGAAARYQGKRAGSTWFHRWVWDPIP